MLNALENFVKHRKKLLFFLIFIFSFLIISFGINETGETWDEIPYYNAAKQYAGSLRHLRFKREDWNANKEHPPVAKYVYSVASVFEMRKDGENYTGGRIASALMLSGAISLTFLFATELFGGAVGLLAGIILVLTPSFIGYGRILGMDSPTTLMFTLIAMSFYYFAKSEAKPKDYVAPIILFSLGIATRYNIILSGLFLIAAVLLFAKWRFNIKKWFSLFLFPIFGLIIFYLIWPYLWSDPIGGIEKSVGHWGQVKEWYFGVANAILPNSYFVTYFWYMTPLVILILAAIGLITKPFDKKKIYILVLLLVPFLNSIVGIKQGGIRYLLFVFIPLSILSGIGLVFLLKKVKSLFIQILLTGILIGYMSHAVISYYPYYIDYYNEIMGGAKGDYQKKALQLGWWGEGSKRTVDYLNQNAPVGASVFNNMQPRHTLNYMREDIFMVQEEENPDFIVFNTQWGWASEYKIPQGYRIVHQEMVAGAPIITVLKRD